MLMVEMVKKTVSPPGGKVVQVERAEFCSNSPSTTSKPGRVPRHPDDDLAMIMMMSVVMMMMVLLSKLINIQKSFRPAKPNFLRPFLVNLGVLRSCCCVLSLALASPCSVSSAHSAPERPAPPFPPAQGPPQMLTQLLLLNAAGRLSKSVTVRTQLTSSWDS